jgi:hypothetical protein
MKTFEDYRQACLRYSEIHGDAIEARKKKWMSLTYAEMVAEKFKEVKALDRALGEIYFLQESGMSAIKIGTSTNVSRRVRSLECGMPHELTLLTTMSGGHSMEALIHRFFGYARIRSEWFRPVPALLEYIAEIKLVGPGFDGAPPVERYSEEEIVRLIV